MSNQRGTFAKRQREMELKDKARQKEARRAARADRRDQGSNGGGPQIAWDEAVRATVTPDAPTNSVVPTDDS
jgi:hypothetical protein